MLPEPVHARARAHTHTHTSTCARAYTHTVTHFHMCTCIHTHSHTCQPLVRVKPLTSQNAAGWQAVSTVLWELFGVWAMGVQYNRRGPGGTLPPHPHHVPHHLPRTLPSGSC